MIPAALFRRPISRCTGLVLAWGLILLHGSTAIAGMENARFALHRKNKFESSKTIPRLCDDPATVTIEPNYGPNGLPCEAFTTTGPAPGGSTIYFVVVGVDPNVGAVSFGIDYEGRSGKQNGVDPQFNSWIPCANGPQYPSYGGFGDFPSPKGGLRIEWSLPGSCQTGYDACRCRNHVVIGSLYVYAYAEDVVRITPNNNVETGPELSVTDCSGNETNLLEIDPDLWEYRLGKVHLGGNGSQGYVPCMHCGYPDWLPCPPAPVAPATWGRIKTLYRPSGP